MQPGSEARAAASADPLQPLLKAAGQGDARAMGALYDASWQRVHGWTMRILRNRELAEEATSDVFTQAWKKAGDHDPERGTVSAWLCVMARSRALDLARARTRKASREAHLEEVPAVAADVPGPGADFESTERAEAVRAALGNLPEEQRAAVVAAFFGGLSHAEVAETLDEPLGTVKTRIRRGLNSLRDALGSRLGEAS